MKILFSLWILLFICPLSATAEIQHEIKIVLQPNKHHLQVEDTITFPEIPSSAGEKKWHFLLHGNLHPRSLTPNVRITRREENPRPIPLGISSKVFLPETTFPIEYYTVDFPAGVNSFILTYQGKIFHPLEQEGEEYARSFRQTPGTISEDGVFLSAASFWYPWHNDLLRFSLDVQMPKGWHGVSQGERTQHHPNRERSHVRWESPEPQDEIYLVAGRFTEYTRPTGDTVAMVFFRSPEKDLAEKYLDVTVQYIDMYQNLLGPYPYKKFALVENFWETGYGMPSFTLLGPKVIRFPFILHSSYPHEILHSWWGNGVYVDYPSGNWSEGLTAYLADHLVQEQRGVGAAYRQGTLEKYADYVAEEKDFPLTEFREHHGAVTEAVGYGKTLMFFHMLRQQMGDMTFMRALQKFYEENKFKHATFSDLQEAFTSVSGLDLKAEFTQWITRSGAPALKVNEIKAESVTKGYHLTAVIQQTQAGPPYLLRIPLAIYLEGEGMAYQTAVVMEKKRLDLSLYLSARPLRLDLDPEFDLFRRLHREEIPPALSLAFGAERVLILLPSKAPETLRRAYQQLAQSWRLSQSGTVQIKWDGEVEGLPSDRTVWLFGWENRFREKMVGALEGFDVSIEEASIRVGQSEMHRDQHSIVLTGVLTGRHSGNPDVSWTWLATENTNAMPGLGRKLPHYGRYGYLGFKGEEPTNVVKGEWPVLTSPLSVRIPQNDGSVPRSINAKLKPRAPLSDISAVRSAPNPP